MTVQIINKSATFSVAPQLNLSDMAEIAAAGYKTIFNFRPDNEGGESQPLSKELQLAAEKHGLQYHHIPVVPNNIQPEQIAAFSHAFAKTTKPALGFCKSGNRATQMFVLSQTNAPSAKKGMIAWLKSKCLVTKLIRWLKAKS